MFGEVPEWSNGTDSKSVVRLIPHRGFESLLLRQIKTLSLSGCFYIDVSVA